MTNRRALRPDAQAFDEIRLVTKPRYKTSGMSGNEWRISVVIQFFRKGRLIHEDHCGGNMKQATAFVAWKYAEAIDAGKAMFGGEDKFCDQEGCSEQATVKYRIKTQYCVGPGNCGQPLKHQSDPPQFRMFCDAHKHRGDSNFEDCDENYEEIPVTN